MIIRGGEDYCYNIIDADKFRLGEHTGVPDGAGLHDSERRDPVHRNNASLWLGQVHHEVLPAEEERGVQNTHHPEQ